MKAAFALTARNKEKYVAKAVIGALSQTHPCHILLSDQHSDDATLSVIEKTVADTPLGHPDHIVQVLRCPIEGKYGMRAANAHFLWLTEQTDAEWIFQCSADDYSLPGRVGAGMLAAEQLKAKGITPDTIACTMHFHDEAGMSHGTSQFEPGGFWAAGEGMHKLVYGSCIHQFHRDFVKKIGSPGDVTMDVYYGYLAALGRGFFVLNDPQHVHGGMIDPNNMGFGGKIRWAMSIKDEKLLAQINELNHFQLFELYFACHKAQTKWFPLAHEADKAAPIQCMLNQSVGWFTRRKELHEANIQPMLMP